MANLQEQSTGRMDRQGQLMEDMLAIRVVHTMDRMLEGTHPIRVIPEEEEEPDIPARQVPTMATHQHHLRSRVR